MSTTSCRSMIIRLAALIAFPVVIFPAPAAASSSDVAVNYLQMIWGLLIVLGIILILYGLVKKRFSLLASSSAKEIKVLEVKPLMGQKALCLVEVRGQEYLLGIGGDTVTHLASLPGKNDKSFAATLATTGEYLQP